MIPPGPKADARRTFDRWAGSYERGLERVETRSVWRGTYGMAVGHRAA